MLTRRIELLADIAKLAQSLDMGDDVAYTCETSGLFFLNHIVARWEKFTLACKPAKAALAQGSVASSSSQYASKPTPVASAADAEAQSISDDDGEMLDEDPVEEEAEPEASKAEADSEAM